MTQISDSSLINIVNADVKVLIPMRCGDGMENINMNEMASELLQKRDALRWRKYPGERPDKKSECLTWSKEYLTQIVYWNGSGWIDAEINVIYWLPIPPLLEDDK